MNHLSSKVFSFVCGTALLVSGMAFGVQAAVAATATPAVTFTAPASDQVAVTWPIGVPQILRWTEKDIASPKLVSLSLIPVGGNGSTFHMSSFNALEVEPSSVSGGDVVVRVLSKKITVSSVVPTGDYNLAISISTTAGNTVSSQSPTLIHIVTQASLPTTCDGQTYSILTPNTDDIWKVGGSQRITGCGIGQMNLALYNADESVSYPLHALSNNPTSSTTIPSDWNFADSFVVPKTVPPGYYHLGLVAVPAPGMGIATPPPVLAAGSVTIRSSITTTPTPTVSDLMITNPTTTDATSGNWYQDQIAHISWSMSQVADDGFRVTLNRGSDGPELYILKSNAIGHSLSVDPSTIAVGSYTLVVSAAVHGYATTASAPVSVAATSGTASSTPYVTVTMPTGVATISGTTTTVTLSWQSNINPVAGYGIYLVDASQNETFIRRVQAKQAIISFANTVPGAYTLRVRAAANGVSAFADSPVVNVVDDSNPGIPADGVVGYRDSLSCSTIGGWACIPGQGGGLTQVRVLTENGRVVISPFTANVAAPDASAIAAACTGGDGNRRFAQIIPASLKDGQPHTLTAQAEDATGVWRNLETIGSSNIQCSKDSGTPPTKPTPLGVVDSATCDAISGWACDAAHPLQNSSVRFTIDGNHTFRTTAANSRADLVAECGSADHGFTATLPNAYRDGNAHQVTASLIYDGGKQTSLSNGAFSLQCAPGSGPSNPGGNNNPPAPTIDPRVVGSQDGVTCDSVTGWACLPGRGGNSAYVRVVDENGKVIRAGILANDPSVSAADGSAIAAQCGGGDGNRRYTFKIPASDLDGATHSVIVQGRDLNGKWAALSTGASTSIQCTPPSLPTAPATTNTHGVVDGSACTGYGTAKKQPAIFGWACDTVDTGNSLKLKFYKSDGTAIPPGIVGGDTATTFRQDLVDANVCGGTGGHGFTATFPRTYKGQDNTILVYALDPVSNKPVQIGQTTLSCSSTAQDAIGPSEDGQGTDNAAAIGDSGQQHEDGLTSFWNFLWQ